MKASPKSISKLVSLALSCWILWTAAACAKKPTGKRYDLEGRVVAVDSASRVLTIAHGEVAGLMPAMTMPFPVSQKDDWVFGRIAPGDQLRATLVISDHAELQGVSFAAGADLPSDGTSNLRVPQPGDVVPDFTFVNQAGKKVHFEQFRGKPLLLTFIYTRCPLPDYCLLMSNNFGEILNLLKADPDAAGKAELLSISIDPEFDTPKVLREYGTRYTGNLDPKFEHWQFVSGTPKQVRDAADYFGLSYDQQAGQIVHSLRTVLIGADGKIDKVYSGNRWKPGTVAKDYIALLRNE